MKITKARLKQIIKEELDEIKRGRQPRLQKGRPAVDDREYYDPNHLELEKEVDAMNLGDDLGKFPPDPTYEEKRAFITRINKRLQKAQDRETINKLRDLKRKIDLFYSEARFQRARRGAVRDSDRDPMFREGVKAADDLIQGKVSINEELTRQDKTDVKKMVQDELEKLLKKKDTKDQMGEIVKKIMKKLYKDLSLEHPYIIDRIKI
jgi:hypothetical protein